MREAAAMITEGMIEGKKMVEDMKGDFRAKESAM